jgi:hypothetical protein
MHNSAIKLAAEAYDAHPYYAWKMFNKFPAPMVERGEDFEGDYHGYWYEALYEACVKWPEKATQRQLLLTMAYRHLMVTLRNKNFKCRQDFMDLVTGDTLPLYVEHAKMVTKANTAIDEFIRDLSREGLLEGFIKADDK